MQPPEEPPVTEQRACDKCKAPCCLGEFKQVAALKNSGLLIYVSTEIETDAEQRARQKKNNYIFIIHNAGDRELKRPDYIKEMCQYRTKCVQCKEFLHRVRSLLDDTSISDIKQNEVICVCQYCRRVNLIEKSCKRCEYFVNKFKCCQANQQQVKHEQLLSSMKNVNALIQNILECRNICTSRLCFESSIYFNVFFKLLQELKLRLDFYRPDMSLLPKVLKSDKESRLIEMLEELLEMKFRSRLNTMPKILKSIDSKITPKIEQSRLPFMEEKLFLSNYDSNLRLISKLLEYIVATKSVKESEKSASTECLVKHKQSLEELLLKNQYYRMREHPLDYISENKTASEDICLDYKINAEEKTSRKKEDAIISQKSIKKNMPSIYTTVLKEEKLLVTDNLALNDYNVKKTNLLMTNKSTPDVAKTEKNMPLVIKHKNKEELLSKKGSSGRQRHGSYSTNSLNDVENTKKHKKKGTMKIEQEQKDRKIKIKKNKKRDSLGSETRVIIKKILHSIASKDDTKLKDSPRRIKENQSKKLDLINMKASTSKKLHGIKIHVEPNSDKRQKNKETKILTVELPCSYEQTDIKDQSHLPEIYNSSALSVSAVHDTLGVGRSERQKLPPRSYDDVQKQGGFLYKLSDKSFIKNGWTILPKVKTQRKVRIFKMEPADPKFDWFENNKNNKIVFYDSGEKLAEVDDDGYGRWYYKNGEVALDFYRTEKGRRYVVYSRGDEVYLGKTSPRTILASFDFCGNGVVYDRYGNERLKYNQFNGVLYDKTVGPVSQWNWHSLNEPPELQKVEVDNYVKQIDTRFKQICKNVKTIDPRQPRVATDATIQEIEYEQYAKQEALRLAQKFKPFKIRMKVLKMNGYFSLRVLSQSNIYIMFREGSLNLKLNVGMNLIKEVIETEMIETDDVVTPYGQIPPLSQSLANIQKTVDRAKRVANMRAEKTERLLGPSLLRSAHKIYMD